MEIRKTIIDQLNKCWEKDFYANKGLLDAYAYEVSCNNCIFKNSCGNIVSDKGAIDRKSCRDYLWQLINDEQEKIIKKHRLERD